MSNKKKLIKKKFSIKDFDPAKYVNVNPTLSETNTKILSFKQFIEALIETK